MPFPIIPAGTKSSGYTIAKSLRFRSSASAYLSRTPSSAGNRKTWTWSGWVKLGSVGTGTYNIFGGGTAASNWGGIEFDGTGSTISVRDFNGTGNDYQIVGTPVYRDYSAWYHLVVKFDDTQAASSSRLVIYINGTQIAVTGTYPTQNTDYRVNNAVEHRMMRYMGGAANYLDGYLTEVNFIDGQALDPTYFGQTDTATGVWMPKAYTGTYGTNGFYLQFTDVGATSGSNTGYGKDFSGNSNYWTTNNLSSTAGTTYDSMVDTPTNYDNGGNGAGNYCVLNPLTNSTVTISNANLTVGYTTYTNWIKASFGITSGKWYWEIAFTTSGAASFVVGLSLAGASTSTEPILTSSWWYLGLNGSKYDGNSTPVAYGASYGAADIVGVAFDADAGTLTFYKNNVSQGTASTGLTNGPYFPSFGFESSGITWTQSVNFGQRPFTYTPPTGFKALCTQNLPTPTIGATSSTLANKYFDILTYTGNGALTTRTGLSLGTAPGMVWLKGRSVAGDHTIVDSNRGTGVVFSPATNATNAEGSSGGGWVQNLSTTGFSTDVNGPINTNGTTYVSWVWAGGSNVSNTNGSITSTVSANVTAGFSVVTYTSPNLTADQTVGHGLGVAPSMIIAKNRDTAYNWDIWHKSLSSGYGLVFDTSAQSAGRWPTTAPTSTVFSTKNTYEHNSTNRYVAYCFAEVAGYSKFGSYTGNGSADGPFVYCGFRPKYVLIKYSSSTGSWYVLDSVRDTYNVAADQLYPNLSDAEYTAQATLDFTSNGFKIRGTGASFNTSGGTYIFAAFAETPFNYSRGR